MNDSALLSKLAIEGIVEKKGHDIVQINLQSVQAAICDYFIICHGDSDRHVKALAESIEKVIKDETEDKPYSVEGLNGGDWIILDYIDIIIHVFIKEKRDFYDLENLWSDGKFVYFNDFGKIESKPEMV